MQPLLKVTVRHYSDDRAHPFIARAEGMPEYKYAKGATQDEALARLRWEYPESCGDRPLEVEVIEIDWRQLTVCR